MSHPNPVTTATKHLLLRYLICFITSLFGMAIFVTLHIIFSVEDDIVLFGLFLGLFPAIEITGRYFKNLYGYKTGNISSIEFLEEFNSKISRMYWIRFFMSTILGAIFLSLAMMNGEEENGMMKFFGIVGILFIAAAIVVIWIEQIVGPPIDDKADNKDESVLEDLLNELDSLGGVLQIKLPSQFNKWLKSPIEGRYYTLEESQFVNGKSPLEGDELSQNQTLFVIEKDGVHHEVISGAVAIIEEIFPSSLDKVEINEPIYRLRKKEDGNNIMRPLV